MAISIFTITTVSLLLFQLSTTTSAFQNIYSSSAAAAGSMTTSKTALNMKVIDSHLHVWADSSESKDAYPYASQDLIPPPSLIDTSSANSLLARMDEAGVDGALIVQPINHKYDHRYVQDAIKNHPDKFKGMMLFDPTTGTTTMERFEELVLKGFAGVRFNPYLFEGNMSENESALAIMKRCAELNMPVGIMVFKGIELHFQDILQLMEKSPDTIIILDHFGFAKVGNDEQFDLVMKLAQYSNVHVKISALFRVCQDDEAFPYERVRKERFEPLLEAYGADRLMFGTDFPYVQDEAGGYKGAVDTVSSWCEDNNVRSKIMGGNVENLFGSWMAKAVADA